MTQAINTIKSNKKSSIPIILFTFGAITLLLYFVNIISGTVQFLTSKHTQWNELYKVFWNISYLFTYLFSFSKIAALLFAIGSFILGINWNKIKKLHCNLLLSAISLNVFSFIIFLLWRLWNEMQNINVNFVIISEYVFTVIIPILSFVTLLLVRKNLVVNLNITLIVPALVLSYFIFMTILNVLVEINFIREVNFYSHLRGLTQLPNFPIEETLWSNLINYFIQMVAAILFALIISGITFALIKIFKIQIYKTNSKKINKI